MLLGALLLVCSSSESQQGWSGTKPVLVATGSAPPAELCEFPSSLNRFGNSSSLLLIAQGNTDAEMPHGGYGREFASYDDGASWHEIGPAHPTDGKPRKGVACTPGVGAHAADQLTCIPFRLHVNETVPDNHSAFEPSLVWQTGSSVAQPTRIVSTVNVSVNLPVPATMDMPLYPGRFGLVPDMATPIRVKHEGSEKWFLTMYGVVNGSGGIVSLTSIDGRKWNFLSIVSRILPAGAPCSEADEDAVARLPDGRLAIYYRNSGPGGAWSSNVPLCTQVSGDEGLTWSEPKAFPTAAPTPSPTAHPPAKAGTPLAFWPCGEDTKLQSWKYDGKTLRAGGNDALCVDHTDILQLRLQPCNADLTNQSWAFNATSGGGSFIKATGLGDCASGSGPPAVPGCCLEVSGGGSAPGTAADIYHCAATSGVRAPNEDFTIPNRSSGEVVVTQPAQFCLTAQTWTPPKPPDPSLVPHGVEPKALVLGRWLVLIGGREGLFLYYTPHAEIGADGLPTSGWQRFNIAAHHNEYYGSTDQAFSSATLDGSGGDSETTGYMGATVSADGKAVIICYDRTVSHLGAQAQAKAASGGAMAFNTVYCFRVAPPRE
eukprot:COSAG02_NODE_2949_length_7680_cov_4.274238_7_plen_600_part_00